MEMNQFGVWSIKIPDCDGNPAIPHNSGVKLRFKHGNGAWIDRIPACIKYATVEPGKFAAPYDGVYWGPPPSEKVYYRVEETLEESNHKKSVSFSESNTTNGEENDEKEFASFENSDVEFASS